jgi:hypothetical protein
MIPRKVIDLTEEAILEEDVETSVVEEYKRLSDRCDAIVNKVKARKYQQKLEPNG